MDKNNKTSRRNFIGALVAGASASAIPMTTNDGIGERKMSWEVLKPGIYEAIGGYLEACVWEEPTKENHDMIIQTLKRMLCSPWKKGYLSEYKFVITKYTKYELTVKFGWKENEDSEPKITTFTVYIGNHDLDGEETC